MEKTRKQRSINKILTLMLAFVMVFTGMGIGSWGVSEAWADGWNGTDILKPSQSEDGTYQISTAAELAWFAGLVNGKLTDGTAQNTAANAILTQDIDLNKKEVYIKSFEGKFDGNGYRIDNLKLEANSTNKAYGFFTTIKNGAEVKRLEIVNAQVSGGCFAILVGQTYENCKIYSCAVKNSKVDTTDNGTGGVGVITGRVYPGASIQSCYSLNNEIVNSGNAQNFAGLVGCIKKNKANNENVRLLNCYVAGLKYDANSSYVDPITRIDSSALTPTIEQCYFISDKDNEKTSQGEKKSTVWIKSDEAITALGASFVKDVDNQNEGYPRLKHESETTVDKTALQEAIAEAKAIDATKYYTENDRYNAGKESKNGFWTDMQAVIDAAQSVYDDTAAAQAQVDDATATLDQTNPNSALYKAIANLIPKTQINATTLHEAVQGVGEKTEKDYTSVSWAAFTEAKAEAEALLGKLYDDNGATAVNRGPAAVGEDPEGAIHQYDADAAESKLTEAMGNLLRTGDKTHYEETTELVAKRLANLIAQAEKAKEADYTADSWQAFTTALSAAKTAIKPELTGFGTDKTTAETYWKAYEDLYTAYYYTLVSANEFSVQFELMDGANARAGKTAAGVSEKVTLKAGTKLFDLTAQYGYSEHSSSTDKRGVLVDSDGNRYNSYAVMINGVLVSRNFKTLQTETLLTGNPVLHPGDEVCFIPVMNPRSGQGATIGDIDAYPWQYLDWVKTMQFETEDTLTAEAGKPFTVTLKQAAASLEDYDGKMTAASDMTIFTSEAKTEQGGKVETNKLTANGKAVTTGEDGTAELTLYSEGWYLIQAYDLAADKMGSVPNYEADEWSKGDYHSVNSGAAIWVYVGESSDAAKVKSELKAELDKVYKAYAKDFFRPENWAAIEKAYSEGINGLEEAETIGTAYEAQQEAIVTIKNIQQQTETENETNVSNFRKNLNKLPDDMELLSESVKSTVEALLSSYDGMSDYQKTLLTAVETDKYEKIKAEYEKGLAEAKNYKLTLNIVGDTDEATAALNNMADYLKTNLAKQDTSTGLGQGAFIQKVFAFQDYAKRTEVTEAAPLTSIRLPLSVDYAAYFHVRDADGNTISGEGWSVSDGEDGLSFVEKPTLAMLDYYVEGNLAVTINGKLYEVKSITYEGIDESEVTSNTYAPLDYSTYKGKNKDKVNLNFKDAYKAFTMPYNDVTVTVKWGPVEVKSLTEAIEEALQELETARSAYKESDYTPANWTSLTQAYDEGVEKIKAASDLETVTAAKKDAIGKMAGISKKADTTARPSDLGKEVGKVKVIVENFTASPSKIFAEGWYTLQENDTMMTLILKALDSEGYTWTGTGGTKGGDKDYTITYLASIIDKDGNSLGEFSTTSGSGWMATLNDWFVNFGLQEFGASKTGFCKVENGDEIHAMFTEDLGADIGGGWDDSDTSLKALSISGGTLVPTFSSSKTEYKLVVPAGGASVKVTPTASNKNYLVRTFLNQYNVDSACYKRTESFTVKEGDTIYIGVGDRRWPSMNNNAGYEIEYTGTKYAIQVVSGSDSSAVKEMLKALKTVTLNNYKNEKASIESARAAYDALSAEAKEDVTAEELKKLTDAESKVTFYTEIDDVKTKLAALTDSSSSSQAREAFNAYNKLTDEQRKYITKADAAKYKELAAKYNLSGITGAEEMPESEVVTEGKSGSAITTSPAEVKMSGTTAAVTIKADNQKEILKQAKENKSAQVVLTVAEADAKGAEKYELSLEKSFLQSLLKDTGAKLVVKTPMGQKTYDREALQKLVDEATTATIKAEINKDNLDQQIEEPTVDVKALTAKLTPVARSAKTAKKNVKVTVSLDKQDKEILSQLKEAGYTVKYRFYRSTKKSAGYKSTVTKKTATYTNTSGKKGTKYFYKVQVRVYDANGKLVAKTALKQCRYATRTWSR